MYDMTNSATVYNTSTGLITRYVYIKKDPGLQTPSTEEDFILGYYDSETQFVPNGVLQNRPTMLVTLTKNTVIADEVDFVGIQNPPLGAELYHDDIYLGTTDEFGDSEITYDLPDTHTIKLVLWPYKTFEETVYAV